MAAPIIEQSSALSAMAEHFNAARAAAWPARRSMGDLLRMHRRTVRRALESLEGRGFIACITVGGPHRSAGWRLVFPPDAAGRAKLVIPFIDSFYHLKQLE